jgi:hypothetical protein
VFLFVLYKNSKVCYYIYMFFKNVLAAAGTGFCILFGVFMLMSFSSKKYEVHVTSETLVEDSSRWEIQTILDPDGNYVPSKEWKKVLDSGDYTPVSVASLELRKQYSSSEGEL